MWIVMIGNSARYLGTFPTKEDADAVANDVRWSQAYGGFSVSVFRVEPLSSVNLRPYGEENDGD